MKNHIGCWRWQQWWGGCGPRDPRLCLRSAPSPATAPAACSSPAPLLTLASCLVNLADADVLPATSPMPTSSRPHRSAAHGPCAATSNPPSMAPSSPPRKTLRHLICPFWRPRPDVQPTRVRRRRGRASRPRLSFLFVTARREQGSRQRRVGWGSSAERMRGGGEQLRREVAAAGWRALGGGQRLRREEAAAG